MSDKMLREALEEGRDLFIDYACEGNENTPLEPLRSWLDKSAAALCATPPEGGRILFDPSDHTSPSLPAKEERRCKCGHTRLDHYPDSPCAICACEVYRPAQPAAQSAALASQGEREAAAKPVFMPNDIHAIIGDKNIWDAIRLQDAEIKALRAELDAAWGVRGDTNITDEYKRGFMAALYTVHTAMLAARKDGSS
jgi:hypothetical protein